MVCFINDRIIKNTICAVKVMVMILSDKFLKSQVFVIATMWITFFSGDVVFAKIMFNLEL